MIVGAVYIHNLVCDTLAPSGKISQRMQDVGKVVMFVCKTLICWEGGDDVSERDPTVMVKIGGPD